MDICHCSHYLIHGSLEGYLVSASWRLVLLPAHVLVTAVVTFVLSEHHVDTSFTFSPLGVEIDIVLDQL